MQLFGTQTHDIVHVGCVNKYVCSVHKKRCLFGAQANAFVWDTSKCVCLVNEQVFVWRTKRCVCLASKQMRVFGTQNMCLLGMQKNMSAWHAKNVFACLAYKPICVFGKQAYVYTNVLSGERTHVLV